MIGIVDITTIGSTIFQKKISELGGNDYNHIEFAVHSIPFSSYYKCLSTNNWEEFAELINISIEKLEMIGAKVIVIPANAPHYAFPLLKISVKLLNIVEVVKEYCVERKYKSLLVLGTNQTMFNGLYDKYFLNSGVNMIKPNHTLGNQVHNLIFNEIIPKKINKQSLENIKAEVNNIEVDCIALACTEFPEVYNQGDFDADIIDTTRLFAIKAYEIYEKSLALPQ